MPKIAHMLSACIAAASLMGAPASGEELRARFKPGIWEFHFTRTFAYPEGTPTKARNASPCTYVLQASDTNGSLLIPKRTRIRHQYADARTADIHIRRFTPLRGIGEKSAYGRDFRGDRR